MVMVSIDIYVSAQTTSLGFQHTFMDVECLLLFFDHLVPYTMTLFLIPEPQPCESKDSWCLGNHPENHSVPIK